jgi:predicted GIY-YIG superfamily endonuclease
VGIKYYYTYQLESLSIPGQKYTGFTTDLRRRLAEHNSGKLENTACYVPWRITSAHAFLTKHKALAFETYLKSGSGREFAMRHF